MIRIIVLQTVAADRQHATPIGNPQNLPVFKSRMSPAGFVSLMLPTLCFHLPDFGRLLYINRPQDVSDKTQAPKTLFG